MIRIAAGEHLTYRQEDITFKGHAIECRISAEDPDHGFLPCAGKVDAVTLPGGYGVRVDTLLYPGCEIPPFYDSMMAKVIVHGRTREAAVRKMQGALREMSVEGIKSNLAFQCELTGSRYFAENDAEAINEMLEERCSR
jgi:acetyl-CoA carboxylase biotin carboxylase subunit